MVKTFREVAEADVYRLQRQIGGDDPLLSIAQASRRLAIPLSTLSDAIRNKRLPALVMPDARKYVRLSVVRAYLASRSNTGVQDNSDDVLIALSALSQDKSLGGSMPKDLSAQHDHYLYGTPKRKRR